MSKKSRADEAGDSDELQALFDSIAGQDAPAPVTAVAVLAAAAVAPLDESGDSD